MAARDRYGGFGEPATTPLQRLIQNACNPQNYEPNLALDLEIADLINSKKGTAPREAAVSIVGHVNNRNPNISLHALTLLDICAKNCGYPFHLQISTKEFLNELVRRFPERPPMRYSRVQSKILELIEEWRSTICQTSKYKEDLGFIRDMHRLLSYKGYTFPAVRREDAAVLNPSDSLKSAEEMEAEEQEHHSAKLQELIRRGTPHDLQEANRLMKVMAGYDNRRKTDYRAKAAEEVGKIQQKARILEEMLENYRTDDKESAGGAEELSNALASAQPKIQKMCEEESDDHEAVAKLFEINDSIHRTIERYKLVKTGDVAAASRIPKGTLGSSGAGVSKGPGNELSLIDFGPADSSSAPTSGAPADAKIGAQTDSSLENDLIGLSLGDNTQNAGGQISLGGGPAQQQQTTPSTSSKQNIMNAFNTPPPQSTPYNQQSLPQTLTQPPSYAQSQPLPQIPLQSSTPQPSPQQSSLFSTSPAQAQQLQPNAATQQRATSDPFASLSSISNNSTRTSSPFQFQQAARPPPSQPPPQGNTASFLSAVPAVSAQNGSSADDEWNFTSALPDDSRELFALNSSLQISLRVSPKSPSELHIKSSISNNIPTAVTDFTFQAAVSKGVTLKMEPQSSRSLGPSQRAGITQVMRLIGQEGTEWGKVRVRWKAGWLAGNERREESGEVSGLVV